MAVLGSTTLAEAERHTREADRGRGGRCAVTKLADRNKISSPRTAQAHSKKQTKAKKNQREGQVVALPSGIEPLSPP